MKRNPLSKKVRFEVFKRDRFKCAYCGRTPPLIILEIDHIIPISKHGGNQIENLITACFDCNRGKSNRNLSSVPKSIKNEYKKTKEGELQLKEYSILLINREKRIKREIEKISKEFTKLWPGRVLTENFKNRSLRVFLQNLTYFETLEALKIAFDNIGKEENIVNYWCGICWNKIKGNPYGQN